ncbi:MAG: methylated-DNA--[protein]-cysteine S-methyltransferase [Proteobacteria bacterium]|nr:methylated-DNA--[protein]-cysteine S-methyltransferase [Pseudomonadota bacterium]MDA1331072.1 methylated-DNA--[protein]-cysteine S-methyltransferase [Pseudomonadota bacterium]
MSVAQLYIRAPFGYISVLTTNDLVIRIDYCAHEKGFQAHSNKLSVEVMKQINAYLIDPSFTFDLPLNMQGSSYRKRVWDQIAKIPAGETKTYGEIAVSINSSARAVGRACGDNPFPLVIACHRVVARNGIGGFMHSTGSFALKVKYWLLTHEAKAAR